MSTQHYCAEESPAQQACQGMLDILPLALAVIPWGVLCGSLAIEVGLTSVQAQAMSLLVFAGAAQLASLSLLSALAPLGSILGTTFVISSRHLLYSAVFREHLRPLNRRWRLALAFVLTDELFAVTVNRINRGRPFNRYHALSVGFGFYLIWNLATFLGIVLGNSVPSLEGLGFEFAIAATFIAIVVPNIRDWPTLVCVVGSGAAAIGFEAFDVPHGLILATGIGMTLGWLTSKSGRAGSD